MKWARTVKVSTMITRHFYKQDEVLAALVFCICTNRAREAVFWAQELIDSNLILECFQTLVISWTKLKSIGGLAWFTSAMALWDSGELDEEKVILLTYQLACCFVRDASPLVLLVLLLKKYPTVPERLRTKAVGWEALFRAAVAERKVVFAWLILRIEWMDHPESVWDLLESLNPQVKILRTAEKVEFLEGMKWVLRATAVASLFPHPKSTVRDIVAPDIEKSRREWAAAIGGKVRREYAIPRDCLYGITERGRMVNTETTVNELGDLLEQMEIAPYWSEALGGRAFLDLSIDEQLEFTELYFPDGHPVTWLTAEKEKSHGYGVLRPGEEIETVKYWRTWIRREKSLLIWKGVDQTYMELEGKKGPLDYGELYAEMLPSWREEMSTWCLEPAKKILVV
jgi:hypothetical protein